MNPPAQRRPTNSLVDLNGGNVSLGRNLLRCWLEKIDSEQAK
jgi:hypothetical protein